MKTAILSARVEFLAQPFVKPLQISSGLITQATEARVEVEAEVAGRRAIGKGSIYLSDLWAWPGSQPDRATKDLAMRALCRDLANTLAAQCGGEAEHPLELGLRLHHSLGALAPAMPLLARAVCASPFDAALHDATGQALGCSAFRFYDNSEPIPSADSLFPNHGACESIRRLLREPRRRLDAWWLVSAADSLEETVKPAVARTGIRSFKIKLLARDNAADVRRTVEVYRSARSWGLEPRLSIDSNEGNPDAASVADFLDRLESFDPAAFAALEYLEQPTSRDITTVSQDWHAITKRKPILLDEGLTSLDLLQVAVSQGWGGLALKTCKGHSFALASAAWAHERGLALSLQDLTNPGYSAIHSFLLGAHLPTINGVELNSPQYTPAANQPWLPALEGLFEPRAGVHQLDEVTAPGLGSRLGQVSV